MISFLLLGDVATAVMAMPDYLAGCWEQQRDDDRWTEECWTDGRGGVMLGAGRDGKGDSVSQWEWMRIEQGADGVLVFYGSLKGAPALGFRATETDGRSITFVNASHDYPQRIRYEWTDIGLNAETSLADGSKAERWSYRRTAGTRQE